MGHEPGCEIDDPRLEARRIRQSSALVLRELVDTFRREQALLRELEDLSSVLNAIRSSRSWRALEQFRALRLRLDRMRADVRNILPARWLRKARGVPAAVLGQPLGVNVSGYVAAESGMGEAVRASIRALELAGVPCSLENLASGQRNQDVTYNTFSRELTHPFNLVHLNADNMEAFARSKGRARFRNRYTIGYWFWELSRFRREWISAFRYVDEVWVASRFTRSSVGEFSPVPVLHMPLALEQRSPPPLGRAHFGIPGRGFVFLFIFDVSSQIERKNPLAVVRAFRRAGFAAEDAVLVLKFTNAGFDRAGTRQLYQEAIGLNVLMLDGFMNRLELVGLLNTADAYVSLHRAEGFGLTIAEAMALGKPVIATSYSGNVDFMTPDNSFPVAYRLTALTRNYGPYPQGFVWAEPDLDEAAAFMKLVATDSVRARGIGERAASDVRAQFSPRAAADGMLARLREIARLPDAISA